MAHAWDMDSDVTSNHHK